MLGSMTRSRSVWVAIVMIQLTPAPFMDDLCTGLAARDALEKARGQVSRVANSMATRAVKAGAPESA